MSQPSGYYRKQAKDGRLVTHPITEGGGPYSEDMAFGEGGNMQVQEVRHENPEKKSKHDMLKDIKNASKWAGDKYKEYRETHSSEAELLKKSEELEMMEYKERLEEKRADLEERIRQKKLEKADKAIEDEERIRQKRAGTSIR